MEIIEKKGQFRLNPDMLAEFLVDQEIPDDWTLSEGQCDFINEIVQAAQQSGVLAGPGELVLHAICDEGSEWWLAWEYPVDDAGHGLRPTVSISHSGSLGAEAVTNVLVEACKCLNCLLGEIDATPKMFALDHDKLAEFLADPYPNLNLGNEGEFFTSAQNANVLTGPGRLEYVGQPRQYRFLIRLDHWDGILDIDLALATSGQARPALHGDPKETLETAVRDANAALRRFACYSARVAARAAEAAVMPEDPSWNT